jgi:preprotein translocase SecE subunit
MAKTVKGKTDKKSKTTKPGKKNIFARLRGFFSGLRKELKQVVWPDRKKIKKTSLVSIVIIFVFVAVIFLTDTLITAGLNAGGFYDPDKAAEARSTVVSEETEATPSETEPTIAVDTDNETEADETASETSE